MDLSEENLARNPMKPREPPPCP
eukprot:Gb_03753 [translate_table: standard]